MTQKTRNLSAGVRLAACRAIAKIMGDIPHATHPRFEEKWDEAVRSDAYGRVWVSVDVPVSEALLVAELPSVPGSAMERRRQERRADHERRHRGGARNGRGGNDGRSGNERRARERRVSPPITEADFSDWYDQQARHPDPTPRRWWGWPSS